MTPTRAVPSRSRTNLPLIVRCLVTSVFVAPVLAQADTINPVADAYVRSGTYQNTNFGTATTLQIKKSASATDDFNREIYLQFDLSGVTSIRSARLELYGSAGSPEVVTSDLYSAADISWTESGITWANRPATGPVVWSITALHDSPAWHGWDITRFLKGEKASGRDRVTLVLKNSVASTTGTIAFNSRQNASNRPRLVIEEAHPWTYLEAEAGTRHSGTSLDAGTSWGQVAYEARGRRTVTLYNAGHYVEWKAPRSATHATVRYSIADGQTGTLGLYVNGQWKVNLALTSVRMRETQANVGPPDGIVRYFDDVMVAVPGGIAKDAIVRLRKQNSDAVACVIDFLELETPPAATSRPDSTWVSVAQNTGNDRQAFVNAINTANSGSKKVWVPAGNYVVNLAGGPDNGGIEVPSGVRIRGAGMWHTVVTKNFGGDNRRLFTLQGGNTMEDFKVLGTITTLAGNGQNVAFRFNDLTSGHRIERVWSEYVSLCLGFHASGTTVRDCRVRNTYKDAIHFARDSSDNLVERNCIRNAGGDNVALVSYQNTGMADNVVQDNVAECGWWGRGFTNIGGDGNILRRNLAIDCAKAGIACIVESYSGQPTPFATNWVIEDNTVVRCGDQHTNVLTAAVAFYVSQSVSGSPMSGRFERNLILEPPYTGARFQGRVGHAGTSHQVLFRYNAIGAPTVGAAPAHDRKKLNVTGDSNLVHTPNTDL